MKIINCSNSLMNYRINPSYWGNCQKFSTTNYSSSNWRPAKKKGVCIFSYNTHFAAKDPDRQNYIVKCHQRLEIRCIIEDVESDAKSILKLKQKANMEMANFLKRNALRFFPSLDYQPVLFYAKGLDKDMASVRAAILQEDIKNMKRALGMLSCHDAADNETSMNHMGVTTNIL